MEFLVTVSFADTLCADRVKTFWVPVAPFLGVSGQIEGFLTSYATTLHGAAISMLTSRLISPLDVLVSINSQLHEPIPRI
jgi:hypothetical protein